MNFTGVEFDNENWEVFKKIVIFSIDIKYKIMFTLSNTNFVKINKLNIMIMLKSGYETGYYVRTKNLRFVTL